MKERLDPACVPPKVMTDGLWMYFYALTAHFGQWVEVVGRRKRSKCSLRGMR